MNRPNRSKLGRGRCSKVRPFSIRFDRGKYRPYFELKMTVLFWIKILILTNVSICGRKLLILAAILIFDQNFNFLCEIIEFLIKFELFSDNFIFNQNFNFCAQLLIFELENKFLFKISIFVQIFRFWQKFKFFDQNFNFCPKF